MAGTPRRVGGRTLIGLAPDQLIWVLLARESTDRERQLDNQLTDLRAEVARIGGRIDREIPENAVSAFKRQRVTLPDGTYGYRVVRPEWEKILTALRRGECNALMVPDIDRAMRDPRTLEDLIDVVEYYGVYVASLTHRPNRGHRPAADLRPAASADDPGPIRGPLQRTTAASQPPASPTPARLPSRRPLPRADQAQARPRRPHQRIRANRIKAQIKSSGRILEPHRLPATPNASRLSTAQQRAWIDPGHPACGEPGPARTARPGPAFQGAISLWY